MKLSEVRKLIKLVESSQINELEIEEEGSRIKIVKSAGGGNHSIPLQSISALPPVTAAESLSSVPAPETRTVDDELSSINSPMVGTFYRAPTPEAPPYVRVGDQVKPGQVLCIIEAMKLMNEIECEVSGEVMEVVIHNAEPVEFNQPLFRVKLS